MKYKIFEIFRVFFLLTFLSFSVNIFAAGTAPTVTPAPAAQSAADVGAALGLGGSENFSDALSKSIAKVVASINGFADSYQSGIHPMALTLLTGLSIIAIAWSGAQVAMTSGSLSEPMNDLITTLFTIGFATWLVSSSGYDTLVKNGIDNLMTDLVNHTPNGTTVDKMLQSFMAAEFDQIGKVIGALNNFSLWDLVTKGGMTIILVAVLFVAMLATSIVGMIAVLTALVIVAIAMAVGPIFIPFMVLEKTSFLFDGWLKFLINACLTKVIIALLLGIGMAALGAAATPQQAGLVEVGSMLGGLLSALAISGVISSLMLTAPSIAGAITSGGAISQEGFAGRMHSTAKTMGRNASVLTSQAAGNKLAGTNGGQGALASLGKALRSSTTQGSIAPGK